MTKIRTLSAAVILALVLGPVLAFAVTDGPPIAFPNNRGRTEASGYLKVISGTCGADGPVQEFKNLRVRVDSNNYLIVCLSGGSSGGLTVDTTTVTGGTAGRVFYHGAGDVLKEYSTAYTGVDLPAGSFIINGNSVLRADAAGRIGLSNSGGGRLVTLDFSSSDILKVRSNDDTAAGTVNSAFTSAGTAPTVANVGANSCGTTAASIAGNSNNGIVTVGTVGGTQCRITFPTAATTRRECHVNNETTSNLARAAYIDTTHSDLSGTFVAGDVLAYICMAR